MGNGYGKGLMFFRGCAARSRPDFGTAFTCSFIRWMSPASLYSKRALV